MLKWAAPGMRPAASPARARGAGRNRCACAVLNCGAARTGMAKKDIVKNGIYQPTEVGKHIYVWSVPGAKPNRDRECVITSHGTDIVGEITSPHPAPQVPLYFYAPHGYALSDASAVGVMRKNTKYCERVAPNAAVHDYVLTKAQGSHSEKNKETYAHLQRDFHKPFATRKEEATRDALLEDVDMSKPWAHKTVATIQADFQRNLQAVTDVVLDVVTIRHRKWPHLQVTMTLFGVIEALESAGFKYSAVHCNFCRGAQGPHQVKDNPHSH